MNKLKANLLTRTILVEVKKQKHKQGCDVRCNCGSWLATVQVLAELRICDSSIITSTYTGFIMECGICGETTKWDCSKFPVPVQVEFEGE